MPIVASFALSKAFVKLLTRSIQNIPPIHCNNPIKVSLMKLPIPHKIPVTIHFIHSHTRDQSPVKTPAKISKTHLITLSPESTIVFNILNAVENIALILSHKIRAASVIAGQKTSQRNFNSSKKA